MFRDGELVEEHVLLPKTDSPRLHLILVGSYVIGVLEEGGRKVPVGYAQLEAKRARREIWVGGPDPQHPLDPVGLDVDLYRPTFDAWTYARYDVYEIASGR